MKYVVNMLQSRTLATAFDTWFVSVMTVSEECCDAMMPLLLKV